jgi:hypothetical protein
VAEHKASQTRSCSLHGRGNSCEEKIAFVVMSRQVLLFGVFNTHIHNHPAFHPQFVEANSIVVVFNL